MLLSGNSLPARILAESLGPIWGTPGDCHSAAASYQHQTGLSSQRCQFLNAEQLQRPKAETWKLVAGSHFNENFGSGRLVVLAELQPVISHVMAESQAVSVAWGSRGLWPCSALENLLFALQQDNLTGIICVIFYFFCLFFAALSAAAALCLYWFRRLRLFALAAATKKSNCGPKLCARFLPTTVICRLCARLSSVLLVSLSPASFGPGSRPRPGSEPL